MLSHVGSWDGRGFWTDKLDETVLLEPAVYLDQSNLTDMEEEGITGMAKNLDGTDVTDNEEKEGVSDDASLPPVMEDVWFLNLCVWHEGVMEFTQNIIKSQKRVTWYGGM